jgi:purine-cytosine permease-like protein
MSEDSPESGEFEREPVPERALLGLKSFVGMYAGEHCAGTELMIGPLFVAAGVSAFDLVAGLLVGNLLAVLSWMGIAAPVATRARLTLYYQLEKICGRDLVTIYNLVNGVMFCFLAGSMITVSATALGVWFRFPMPGLNDLYPNSLGWVVAVLAIGVAISLVAACGYEALAQFANLAVPWMVLVFAAFAAVALKQFIDETGVTVDSPRSLWTLASEHIWKGGAPLPGQSKFGFFHVAFFAWFCNMAMHIGMSDLSVLRFARKSWYAVGSAAGMYVGHFMAWIAAAMLFALQLHQTKPNAYTQALLARNPEFAQSAADLAGASLTPELIRAALEQERALLAEEPGGARLEQFKSQLLSEGKLAAAADARVNQPDPLPGPLADGACGIAGLMCVIVAGWTTANPTIYRAGLAFQAIVPSASRFKVTFATGMLATLAGAFPAIAMKLLGFVALYGMLLMPMGAVVFVDFWLLPRLGLRSDFAEHAGLRFHHAAAWTWLLTLAACWMLVRYAGQEIYFVSLPGWFVAAVLYVVLSTAFQRRAGRISAA